MFGFFASKLATAVEFEEFNLLLHKAQQTKDVCKVLRTALGVSTAAALIELADSVEVEFDCDVEMHVLADKLRTIAKSENITKELEEFIESLSGTLCKPASHAAFVNQVVRGNNSQVALEVLAAIEKRRLFPLNVDLYRDYAVVLLLPRGLTKLGSAGPNLFLVSREKGTDNWELETVSPLAIGEHWVTHIYDAVAECVDSLEFKDLARELMLKRFDTESPESPLIPAIKAEGLTYTPAIHLLATTGLVTYQVFMNFPQESITADIEAQMSTIVENMSKGTTGKQYITLEYEALYGRSKTVDPKKTEAVEATESVESPSKRMRVA